MEKRYNLFIIGILCCAIATMFIALFVITSLVFPLDRCEQYIPDVRQQHIFYFGLNYPYWYGIGQLRQESNCRAGITAFDGGQGLAQFMPATEREAEKYIGPLDLYNPEHAIRAQAWYMSRLHRQNSDGALWMTYQAYNGGWTNLKKEFQRAQAVDWYLMRECCKRKVIGLKNGKYLDLCEVNYDYSRKVHGYGQKYAISADRVRYW